MKRKLRFTALPLVLALLFGQVGINLMHTHQGRPGDAPAALSATVDKGAVCKACAIDGMPVLCAEMAPTFISNFFFESFAAPAQDGTPRSFSPDHPGRAPPVC